jgi:signal transduction histidine kinase
MKFWSSRSGSLVNRLILWACILFALSLPLFWGIFSAAVVKVSQDVVDTRIVEFGNQMRGFWISASASGRANQPDLPILAGVDIEWVAQISEDGAVAYRSPLLRIGNNRLTPTVTTTKAEFALRTASTEIGMVRVAERLVDEVLPRRGGSATAPTHYTVAVAINRYNDQVEQHAARLRGLALIAAIPISLSLFGFLVIIIYAARRNLAGVQDAMQRYEGGTADQIDGQFPTEIQELIDRMNDLLRQNAKLIERTRKYVTKIAHDINHHLAIIKNALAGDVDKPLVERQIERMVGLVDRYSSLARAIGPEGQSGGLTNISEVLEDVSEGFAILYRRTPLTIERDCDDGLTARIPRHDIEAMISNLVSNAHKYANAQVKISARREDGNLVISVADDGPGIPETEREGALNWGRRLDEAPPGTGFGLSIVCDIADLYDGQVTLDTSPLGGLQVDITLPI